MTDTDIIGQASATCQLRPANSHSNICASLCNKHVPRAAKSILGNCEYYYQPLHDEYVKKSGVSTWEPFKAWATVWNPWDDLEVAQRLLRNRDRLIQANSTTGDWSRHANFMMRHIGCGHEPPAYYVSYGYYYCSTYGVKLHPRLSLKGQKWLELARRLLQVNMDDGLRQNMMGDQIDIICKIAPKRSVSMEWDQFELEVSPDKFKKFAFDTHVPAYLDAGLADLGVADLMKIGGQPNIEEWLDKDTWDQAIASGVEVAKHKANKALEAVEAAVDAALRTLTRVFR